MTTPTISTDLIAAKTAEYSNLPGLILGLDGWILRSIPAEHREQFLRGYEKVLRVVFHPDRYQDPAKKNSRQIYLQTIAEAIRFMLSDEYSFEITVDAVPSHKNQLFSLREAVSIRDGIIAKMDQTVNERTVNEAEASKEAGKLRLNIADMIEKHNHQENYNHDMRLIMKRIVERFPVPIGFVFSEIKGRWIGMDDVFLEELAAKADNGGIRANHPWIVDGTWKELVPGKKSQLVFNKSIAEDETHRYRAIGAMTVAHLVEYVRDRSAAVEGGKIETQQARDSLARIYRPMTREEAETNYMIDIAKYIIPFYTSNMLLLLRVSSKDAQDKKVEHRLFLVNKVDAGDDRQGAIVSGLERQIKRLQGELSLAKDRHNDTLRRLRQTKQSAKERLQVKREQADKSAKLILQVRKAISSDGVTVNDIKSILAPEST